MKTVELHPAHIWTCDDCGRDNFARGVCLEMTDAKAQELAEDAGLEVSDLMGVDWMTIPVTVKCSSCGSRFKTVDSRSGDVETGGEGGGNR